MFLIENYILTIWIIRGIWRQGSTMAIWNGVISSKVAIKHNILVMYGENQWVEYSGGHLDEEGGENTLLRRKLNQNPRIKSGVDKLIEIGIKRKFLKNYIKKNKLVEDYRLPMRRKQKIIQNLIFSHIFKSGYLIKIITTQLKIVD